VVPRVHTNMLGMVEGFLDLGHEVILMSSDPSSYIYKNNLRVTNIDLNILKSIDTAKFIWKLKPSLVILRGSSHHTRFIGRLCFILRIKTLIYEQTNVLRDKGGLNALVDLRHAAKIFFLYFHIKVISPIKINSSSSARKRFYAHYFPFPISQTLFESRETKENIFTVIIVGKLNQERKQLRDGLITVRDSGIEGRLVIIGTISAELMGLDRSQELLFEEAARDASNIEIEIFSNLSHKESLRLISRSHVLFLTSRGEPFSVSPLEAMALGTIPIVPDSNGSTFLIRNEIDGFVYPESNWLKASEILSFLFHNKQKLEQMSLIAKERAELEFSPQECARTILNYANLSVLSTLRNKFTPDS
jgi:glycosyltransferase involved in cell wall biosynthesis